MYVDLEIKEIFFRDNISIEGKLGRIIELLDTEISLGEHHAFENPNFTSDLKDILNLNEDMELKFRIFISKLNYDLKLQEDNYLSEDFEFFDFQKYL